jgi:predicted aspartyl protease
VSLPETPATDEDEGGWWTSRATPVVIVLVAALLIVLIIVVARQEQDAGTGVLVGSSVDPDTLPVTVPVRAVAGSLVVDVTIGGDGGRTLPMVLDTGGPTIVSERVAEVFTEGSAGSVAITSPKGEVLTSEVVRLPELSIGGARFSDVGAIVGSLEPGNPSFCLTETGFIGASLLQTGVWQWDPRSSTVTVAESLQDVPVTNDAWRLDFERASDVSPSPLVELAAGSGRLRVLIDTGTDAWLAVSPGDFEAIGGVVPADAPVEEWLASSTGGSGAARAAWSTVSVEPTASALPDPLPIAVIDTLPGGQGMAGTDLLQHFVVTLDWSDDSVYLEPIAASPGPADPPLSSVTWDEGFVVGSRLPGQRGAEDLLVGTPVLAIDGRDVSRASFDDFCRHRLEGPERFELTVAGEEPATVAVRPVHGFLDHSD